MIDKVMLYQAKRGLMSLRFRKVLEGLVVVKEKRSLKKKIVSLKKEGV